VNPEGFRGSGVTSKLEAMMNRFTRIPATPRWKPLKRLMELPSAPGTPLKRCFNESGSTTGVFTRWLDGCRFMVWCSELVTDH
jgi:hypothetical protein